jgi:ABC-type multidrug transport system ATPase subunit
MNEGPNGAMQVRDLTFSWPGRHVFTAWSADFAPGLTWLQGANGTGKSTLLRLLVGSLPALTGSVRLHAPGAPPLDAAANPLAWKREVFWCGPGGIAFDHLTPPEYFGFLLGLYPRFDAEALERHIAGFALAPHLRTRIAALSTGTQRKVWLAAALAVGTRVRLLDEPLNALDVASLDHLQEALGQAATQSTTIWIVASHSHPAAGARTVDLSSG